MKKALNTTANPMDKLLSKNKEEPLQKNLINAISFGEYGELLFRISLAIFFFATPLKLDII